MPEMKLITDGAVLAEILRSPAGPVGRHLAERATVVQAKAKQLAPRRTGCLQDSIVKRWERSGLDLAIRIVSDTAPCDPQHKSYSMYVHDGTAPHLIQARPGGVLAFEIGGETIFATSVQHPGTKPVPFLRDALPLALL